MVLEAHLLNTSTQMSLFGANSAPQTNQGGFGALGQQQSSNGSAPTSTVSTNNPPAPSLQTQSSVSGPIASSNPSKLVKDLLESANNLPRPSNAGLGSLHLTLSELQKRSDRMRKNTEDTQSFKRAHYLLASSGVNADDIEDELKTIDMNSLARVQSSTVAAPPTSREAASNIDNYITTKKDENILSAIEQSLSNASKDFDKFINQSVSIDWKVRRDELRKSFGIIKASEDLDAPDTKRRAFLWNRSLPGNYHILAPLAKDTNAPPPRQMSREKFESHAQVVYHLNEARMSNSLFPLASRFEDANKQYHDTKSRQVADAWRVLIDLTDEKKSKVSQEQMFHTEYLTLPSRSHTLTDKIIRSGKGYLEKQFYAYLDEIYMKDDKKDGFVPATNINKVSYFINKVVTRNNAGVIDRTLNVNGTPLWVLIYYLLRSGLYQDAVEVTNINKELFTKLDKNFPIYLKNYVESGCLSLPSDLSDRIQSEFSKQFAFVKEDSNEGFDPYKYTLYKIIGKCGLSKKALPHVLNLSIEDWTWFHFSIINETGSNHNQSKLVFENYSLEDFQAKILQLGAKRFNSSSKNPLFLKTLLMSGLFESAVQYTYENINECDAVHLAIGLCYYGLLKVARKNPPHDSLFILGSNGLPEINFSRLLGSYTRSFKISDPKVACQYLILIGMGDGGNSHEELSKCHEALRELILISREFNMLLGELDQTTGQKVPGLLERQRSLIQLASREQFERKIIDVAARRCEEEGRTFDALLLYQLCLEFDTVVSLISKLMGEILSTVDLDKPLIGYGNYENINGESQAADTIDNNIILLSQHIMNVFNKNSIINSHIRPGVKETCNILISIISIRDYFVNKEWYKVLEAMKALELVPIDPTLNLVQVRKMAENVHQNQDNNLIKVIPSLLVMVMTSISQLNYAILTKKYQTLGNEMEELSNLKNMARNCMVFAGMIQYKMPGETYSLLINLESLLS